MNFDIGAAPTVRVAVKSPSACPNWRSAFIAAGWRPFGRNARGGQINWLVKRGTSVFALTQPEVGSTEQILELPRADAAEVSSLLVTSGLAVPA